MSDESYNQVHRAAVKHDLQQCPILPVLNFEQQFSPNPKDEVCVSRVSSCNVWQCWSDVILSRLFPNNWVRFESEEADLWYITMSRLSHKNDFVCIQPDQPRRQTHSCTFKWYSKANISPSPSIIKPPPLRQQPVIYSVPLWWQVFFSFDIVHRHDCQLVYIMKKKLNIAMRVCARLFIYIYIYSDNIITEWSQTAQTSFRSKLLFWFIAAGNLYVKNIRVKSVVVLIHVGGSYTDI